MNVKKRIIILFMFGLTAGIIGGCGTETGAHKKDITVISREDGSGTRTAFVELFNMEEEVEGEKVDMTTVEAQITNSTAVVINTAAEDEYAIGYISLGALSDNVKALKIDEAEPTGENVKNGSYRIARPFQIAVKEGSDNKAAVDFIAFMLSEDGQKVVEESGYVGSDTTASYEKKEISGRIVIGGSSSVAPVIEKLAEAYKAVNTKVQIELQVTDSTTGMSETISGNYDIGMASRELKDAELSGGLEPQTIAMDGIAVIVNRENPRDGLSSEQVKGIYSGEILTWDEVEE